MDGVGAVGSLGAGAQAGAGNQAVSDDQARKDAEFELILGEAIVAGFSSFGIQNIGLMQQALNETKSEG